GAERGSAETPAADAAASAADEAPASAAAEAPATAAEVPEADSPEDAVAPDRSEGPGDAPRASASPARSPEDTAPEPPEADSPQDEAPRPDGRTSPGSERARGLRAAGRVCAPCFRVWKQGAHNSSVTRVRGAGRGARAAGC